LTGTSISILLLISYSITTSEDSLSLKFRLDSLLFSEVWAECIAELDVLLSAKLVNSTHLTIECYSEPGTLKYDTDPCCSEKAAWSTVCEPRESQGKKTASLF
jgi:hypothetical protein